MLSDSTPPNDSRLTSPDVIDVDPQTAARKLGSRRVGILGLAGHGTHLAVSLAKYGIGKLILADPYPLRAADACLSKTSDCSLIGQPRHDVVATAIRSDAPSVQVETVGQIELKHLEIDTLTDECDLIVGCFDYGFRSVHYQLNRACLAAGRPALYSELGKNYAWIGPLVIPTETPCYTCFRLRRLACDPDYERAITEERKLGRQHAPCSHELSAAPELLTCAAQILCVETLNYLLSSGDSNLRGRILSFDPATKKTKQHTILTVSDCPECQQPSEEPLPPEPVKLSDWQYGVADMRDIVNDLVSPITGIIRRCDLAPRRGNQDFGVFFCRTELANHWHAKQPPSELKYGFGKGIGRKQALESAIGEALEIYAGSLPSYRNIVFARRRDLGCPVVDPRDLVLYRESQYRNLPYSPYSEETILGWVWARALTSSEPIYVPALAVFLDYKVRSSHELLFPLSSSGLATGRSLAEALVSALYEVLERDAFLITWLNGLPCDRFDPNRHPNRFVRDICKRMEEHGLDLHLLEMRTDHHCRVFMALARSLSDSAPATTIGLGADLYAARAAEKAVAELVQTHTRITCELRQASNRARMHELNDNPSLVCSMLDHALLYASPHMTHAFDFLLQRDLKRFDQTDEAAPSVENRLTRLHSELSDKGHEVYYVDLTPKEVSKLGLYSVRVIVPHLQPIHFGRLQRRLGGTRLFELPVELGLADAPPKPESLNEYPHPLG